MGSVRNGHRRGMALAAYWRPKARRALRASSAVLVLAGLLSSSPAPAQTIPPSVDPGRIPQRFEPPRRPDVEPRIETPRAPTQTPPDRAREIKFVLTGVVVTGSTVYTPEQLAPIYKDRLGKQVTLLDVYQIAAAITAKYRSDGYVLSQAIVPQQQIRAGVVQIQVIEGRINRISIRDEDKITSYNYLLRYAEKIKESQPLRQDVLEHYLLLMNDLPGLRVSGVLAPSNVTGTADLVLEVKAKRVDLFASADNRGSRFLGPYQVEAGGAVNALIDVGDRVSYRAIVTPFELRELQYHEARYQHTLSSLGTVLELTATYTRTRPGFTLKFLDIRGNGYTWGARLRQPIIRSRQQNLWVYGGFDWRNSQNEVLDVMVSDDRLRVIRYGAVYEVVDPLRAVNSFDVQVSHGLDVLGARGNSRQFGRVDFTKVNLEYQRNQPIWGPISAFAAFTGQYAGTQLLAPEEFGLGGRSFGRAFDPSEKTGDHGLAVVTEVRYTFDEIKLPLIDVPAGLQAYGFGDWGRVYHIESNTRKKFETLASAGGGIRFNISSHISGQIEGAVPLFGRVAASGTEGLNWRVFFVVNARY